MPAIVLPTKPNLEAHCFSIVLDNERFIFRFRYVRRTASWYLHLETGDGTRLTSGFRLTSFYPIDDRSDLRWPTGLLVVLPFNKDDLIIRKDSLGDEHALAYFSIDDFDEFVTVGQELTINGEI